MFSTADNIGLGNSDHFSPPRLLFAGRVKRVYEYVNLGDYGTLWFDSTYSNNKEVVQHSSQEVRVVQETKEEEARRLKMERLEREANEEVSFFGH